MGDQGHRPRKSRSRGRAKRGKGRLSEIDPNNLKDARLIGMAIRRSFPMSRRLRAKVVDTIDDGLDNTDPNIQATFVRAAIMAERTNIAAEKLPSVHQHLHVHAPGTTPIEDPDYIEHIAALPTRCSPDHQQPGGASALGDGGAVVSVPASSISQPPANGSGGGKTNGNGRHNGHK